MGLVNFRAVMDFDAFADLFDLLARFERGSLLPCKGGMARAVACCERTCVPGLDTVSW